VAALAAPGRLPAQALAADSAMGAMDTTDRQAAVQAHAAMSGPMLADLHMRMTVLRPQTSADSARAESLVATMRRVLTRYRDVQVAEAEGFREFLPGVQQAVYHFTNWRWALAARFRFDPARPTSLLYRRGSDSGFALVGAMYTAPAGASEDELNRRVPLSVARWHEHINCCLPPRGAAERWRERRDDQPVFGPHSPIATRAACDSVGGRFFPRIFGWMVHVNAFAGNDAATIWGMDPDHGEDHHP
jgi:hypothetical protein